MVDVEAGLFIVADGMGGHASGEIASAIAVETVQSILLGEINPDETRLDRSSMDQEEAIRERLRYATNQASISIRKTAMANPVHAGMGTTLALLLIEDDEAHLGHVGDNASTCSETTTFCDLHGTTPSFNKKSTPEPHARAGPNRASQEHPHAVGRLPRSS